MTDQQIRRIHQSDTTYRPFHSEHHIDFYSLNGVSVLPINTAYSVDSQTFLIKIRDNTFNGAIGENVFEHINKFLDVVGPIKINEFGNFHELDYNVLVKLQECWWKINANEVAPFTRLESYGQRPYANIKTERAHDPLSMMEPYGDLALKKIDDMVYSEKRRVLNSYEHSEASSTQFLLKELKLKNHPKQHIRGVPRSNSIS
ncbi:hypothetical protein Tco_0561716 [Tanacetum coccineum]